MRSSREIVFRVHQEVTNLRMLMWPPRLRNPSDALLAAHLPPVAPVAQKLCGSGYAKQVTVLAEEVLAHRCRLLGLVVDLGAAIDWRRDPVHKKASGGAYFRLIPYLDFERVGDHKIVWELNRHQHLVILAQAFLFTGREEFLREAERQLTSWWQQNRFLRGINWSSALEVAFRALSWIWLDHFAGAELRVRDQLLESLYQHGCYLEPNLSVYFSPNTHLLGEAVALEALGAVYPWFPAARRWKQTGARVLNEQLERQVRADGSHFEQSSYYHVYTLDFFLLHKILGETNPSQDASLRRMAEYLEALMGPARRLPLLGDDDGGRLFGLPFGFRHAGRATQATAATLLGRDLPFDHEDLEEQAGWWLGAEVLDQAGKESRALASRLFSNAGMGVMEAGGVQVLIDGGPFGSGTAGHSHSDTLSLLVRQGNEEILIDPGTYTYISDPEWRNRFRGSAAHNTMRIDSRDQAIPVNAFCWASPPQVELLTWETTADRDYFDGVCRYGGFVHRRRVVFLKQTLLLLVLDEMQGPPGEHVVEQFWHFAAFPQPMAEGRYWICPERRAWLALAPGGQAEITEGREYGWRSPALGLKTPSPVLRVHDKCKLPVRWAAGFGLGGGQPTALELTVSSDIVSLRLGEVSVRFSDRNLISA
jgi:Heparinase II/III-like protein/Heparinase II/III N-terminus